MICKHFGICGGCSCQHLEADAYQKHKESLVLELLKSVMPKEIRPFQKVGERTRRRANFKAFKQKGHVTLGYYQRKSHDLVDLQECLLVVPEIENALPAIRTLCNILLPNGDGAEVFVLASRTGLDVLVTLKKAPKFSLVQREILVDHVRQNQWARLRVNEELIVQFQQPLVLLGGQQTPAEAGGFLQSSDESDALLIEAVQTGLSEGLKSAADLFAGRGTFSHVLAQQAKVDAYEMDPLALEALKKTAQLNQKPIQVMKRDLFQDPLDVKALKKYNCVVIDPPRAGAKAQCEMLAQSAVPVIISISCNPKTFARDAQILVDGGYVFDTLTLIDQFLWSDHMEVVGRFTKGSSSRA